MLLTLTIEDVGKALGGKCDRTSTLRCKKYGVKIYPTDKGPGRWVYAAEFYKALHGPLFPDLVKKYGDRALEAYQAYMDNDPIKLMMLDQEGKSKKQASLRHKPENKRENEILEELKNKFKF